MKEVSVCLLIHFEVDVHLSSIIVQLALNSLGNTLYDESGVEPVSQLAPNSSGNILL